MITRLLLLSYLSISSILAAPSNDLITSLPDYGETPTPHYSGYLDASDGCDLDTNGPICRLHYWLALAELTAKHNSNANNNAPVVLWLNGGPGSTSMIGFLQEMGPLLMNATGGLMENPWSWTKEVNLVVLESPLGVGYSYCSREMNGSPCVNTDRYTASASRAAMVDFFVKFPELASNDFYITGESYAGVYIPTLAQQILDNAPSLNLVGIGVGDPCTDNAAQDESMDSLWYGHKNGLVDDEVYDLLWNTCRVRVPNLMKRGGVHQVRHQLNDQLKSIVDLGERRKRADELYHEVLFDNAFAKVRDSAECTLALRKYLLSSSNGLSQSWSSLYIDDYSLFAIVSDLEDEQMVTYMMRNDVRAALHVTEAPTRNWPHATVGFDYTKEYMACNWSSNPPILNISMIPIYQDIIPRLTRTWIYNGDTDPCVSYEGTRTAVKQIDLPELDGGGYRPWFYRQSATSLSILGEKPPLFGPDLVATDVGVQFGGEVVTYENGLSFMTFHGSGHMVPQFRPQSALHFLNKLVGGGGLSPLLPRNETLVRLTNAGFTVKMNEWTASAKAAPYVPARKEKFVVELNGNLRGEVADR